ncbi:MAG TPA: alpha/beta hydrolase [Ilumatobacter sp.]|nr:alpha/beta hydrolase [Ilumatobacter sp.]
MTSEDLHESVRHDSTSNGSIWSASSGPVDAPRVVLIHGSLDRSAGLLKLSRRFDERFRVTRYDRRGYGRSTPCDGPFDIDAQVGDLIEVVESGTTPCILVAHSFGGNIALALAERRPDLVRAVVTYESPMSWLPSWPGTSAVLASEDWASDPAAGAEAFLRRLIGNKRWERMPPATKASRRAEGPALVGELAALRHSAPWTGEGVRVPVLALVGEFAADHHRAGMQSLSGLLPDCRTVTIAGARHFGPNTHPDEVSVAIIEFLIECGVVPTEHAHR